MYEGIKGTPYVYQNWNDGVIYMNDSTKVEDIKIKLDAYENEVVYFDPARKQEFILDKGKIITFEVIDSLSVKHQFVKIADADGTAFYEVLSSGKALLLKRHWKYLKEADYQGAYNSGVRHDEFIDRTTYYVYKNDGLEKIKLSKGNIMRYFKNSTENYDAIQNYYQVNNLDLGNESDVKKLFAYYNNSI